jgi:hypothetical protein
MKTLAMLLFLVLSFFAPLCATAEDAITVVGELERMRSADHLFRPQLHQLRQYSGFHRGGGNPDRMHCLYEEDGWRVVADHQGPGVVSRIWTTHEAAWGEIRVEVDGQPIFSGNAFHFFARKDLPFRKPLSEVRHKFSREITAERETSGKNEWAVSYVPIPFAKRFRYLQRDVVYANIDVKEFPAGTKIESFLHVDEKVLKVESEKTAAAWQAVNLFGSALDKYERVHGVADVARTSSDAEKVVELKEFEGPGILRGIRLKAENVADCKDVDLCIAWDGEKTPSVRSPLDHGFGSRAQRTLAIGQSEDGWRFLYLPMPFQKNAKLTLVSHSKHPRNIFWEVFVEKPTALPADALYLHSQANQGYFQAGKNKFGAMPRAIGDFFYRVGYTALDWQGAGHVAAYLDLYECQPELDEHVFVDDERNFPDNRWNGTGHEDLFDMAWGHKPVSAPMTSGGSQTFDEVNVKLFWNDPLTFHTAIRFNWEWSFRYGIEPPKDARFASVVYWYGKR